MKHLHHRPMPRAPLAWTAAIAGCAVASASLVAVLALFEQAATPWIAATPANAQHMAACRQLHGSAARSACSQRVVAGVLAASAPRVAVITSGEGGRAR